MFERAHHRRILKLLHLMDAELLAANQCYFGGGTAIAMMIKHWGPIPDDAWHKARQAYGASVDRAMASGRSLLADRAYLNGCLLKMGMASELADAIEQAVLRTAP